MGHGELFCVAVLGIEAVPSFSENQSKLSSLWSQEVNDNRV